MEKMKSNKLSLYASGEDYLEAIWVLKKKLVSVRSIDLSKYMGFSKPSISRAVNILKNKGFIEIIEGGVIILTEIGIKTAEKIYQKHCFLKNILLLAGVNKEIAEKDSFHMKHSISDETFEKIKERVVRTFSWRT